MSRIKYGTNKKKKKEFVSPNGIEQQQPTNKPTNSAILKPKQSLENNDKKKPAIES